MAKSDQEPISPGAAPAKETATKSGSKPASKAETVKNNATRKTVAKTASSTSSASKPSATELTQAKAASTQLKASTAQPDNTVKSTAKTKSKHASSAPAETAQSTEQVQVLSCLANSLQPAAGSRKTVKRVGRGSGSGYGKTAGRGHKGQKSRSGSKRDASFEGGQMPLHMRLPKFGFSSRISRVTAKVRLGALSRIKGDVVNLKSLRESGIINAHIKRARIFLSGSIDRALTVSDIALSKGAMEQIKKAGGKVESTDSKTTSKS